MPSGYSLIMYDPDAIKPSYVHWITGPHGDVLPYQGPTPPPGTGVHRYIFALKKLQPQVPVKRNSQNTAALAKNTVASLEFTVDAP